MKRNIKIQLYKAYVRPILTYATPIWNSTSKSNLKKITQTETATYRTIMRADGDTTNTEIQEILEYEPIEEIMLNSTKHFSKKIVKRSPLTREIGQENYQELGYRVKHRLINHWVQNRP